MRVKICCISSVEEAQLAMEAGAAALGLVGPMPSGPGILSIDEIAEIMKAIPADTETFFLTSATSVSEIVKQHNIVRTSTFQLVDQLKQGSIADLKIALPQTTIVQVVHVLDEQSVVEALEKSKEADILLLDSGNPNLATKELGGTGRIHNWEFSRAIVNQSPVPVYLAGGLNPNNIQEAIKTVRPYGVDLCSGVRSNKKLDAKKLKAFFEEISNT